MHVERLGLKPSGCSRCLSKPSEAGRAGDQVASSLLQLHGLWAGHTELLSWFAAVPVPWEAEGATRVIWGLQHLSGEELGLVNLEKAEGDPISPHSHLQGLAEEGARLWRRSKGHKLKHKFRLNTRKNFFPWVCRALEQLPGEGVESPSLGSSQAHLEMLLCLGRGLDWIISRDVFNPSCPVILGIP